MKLSRRTYWWLLTCIALGILGWLANRRAQSRDLLPQYARHLSQYYQEQEKKLLPLLEDSLRWKDIFEKSLRPYSFPNEEEIAFLQKWSAEPIVWMLFQGSKPIFWTDNALILPDSLLSGLYQQETVSVEKLNTGYYLLNSRRMISKNGPLLVIAAVGVKFDYPVEGPYLKDRFAAGVTAPSNSLIIGQEGQVAVSDGRGTPLFYLSRNAPLLNRNWHLLGLGLFTAAFLFFVIFLNALANYLARRFHPWMGAGLIVGSVLLLRVLAGWLDLGTTFSDLAFFQDMSNTIIFKQTLGEFFLSSLILLWLMVFFHREFRPALSLKLAPPWPAIFTTITYSICIISLLVIIRIFQSMIMESGLVFDFEFIFGLDFRTLLALVSGLIIILAVFLFNHRLLETTSRPGISLPARLGVVALAVLLASPVFYAFHLAISPVFVLLMAIIYLLGMDYTLDYPSLSLTKAVGWLLFFAICTSIMVYNFRQKQDAATRRDYVRILCDPLDQELEQAAGRLKPRLKEFISGSVLFAVPDSFPLPRQRIYSLVQTQFLTEPYLFQHYDFELFGIDRKSEEPLLQGQRLESLRLLEAREDLQASTVADLAYWPNAKEHQYTYLLDLAPADTSYYFFLAFRLRSQRDQRVYGDLIRSIPYKDLPQLPLYSYSIIGGLRTLKQSGKSPSGLRIPFTSLEQGDFRSFTNQEQSTLLYHSQNNYTALLSREVRGLSHALSLFSFVFSLLVLVVIFLSVLNYYWQALPNTFEFSSLNRASLRNRIQRAVLLLILGSFVLVGFVTAAIFQQNALRAGSEQLNEKAQAVLTDLQRNIGSLEENISGIQKLSPLIEQIADIHNMDINIYDLQGQLQLTSAEYLFRQEVTARLMAPMALQALRLPTQSSYRSEEKIGEMGYQSAYVPIRDGNEEIIAYLELPYYANDRELRNDLQSFLSALLNVYVFLLLLAGAIALFVAESITLPISKIGQKLSQFRLGHNEPLEWKSPDEIGQLIAEYNRMIEKLEESAERLRQSEREGAWREMAKQVAHEIKNPLTPMKLNIQHWLRVQEQDPERANSMLSEVAQSIIQQIDGLSRIAEEFSNFAKMPQARNEDFNLNKLVASVYNLYAKGDHGNTQLSLDLPDQPLDLYADPTQLMRVINNLVKNALQAIPDNQEGKVGIKLVKKKEQAVLSVTDNGSGIAESLQEKVFFPNFTTKSSGMGLGLAMSRSIVHAAGGRIYFVTEEGKGTTFYVELPIKANKGE